MIRREDGGILSGGPCDRSDPYPNPYHGEWVPVEWIFVRNRDAISRRERGGGRKPRQKSRRESRASDFLMRGIDGGGQY